MKKAQFTEEQIIAILREQEAGVSTAEVCGKHGFSTATLQVEGQVRRHRRVGRQAAEGAGRREQQAKADVGGGGGADVDGYYPDGTPVQDFDTIDGAPGGGGGGGGGSTNAGPNGTGATCPSGRPVSVQLPSAQTPAFTAFGITIPSINVNLGNGSTCVPNAAPANSNTQGQTPAQQAGLRGPIS
jgi:Transposase